MKAFRDAVSETADLAGQHEVISENLTTVVLVEIAALVKEMKEDRKKVREREREREREICASFHRLI